MLSVDEQVAPAIPSEPRSADLTRPLRLGRLAIVAGSTLTVLMVAMLSLGVGRGRFGFASNGPPVHIEMRVQNPGASGRAAFRRQIGISPDGSEILFITQNEDGENVLAKQEVGSSTAEISDGAATIPDERRSDDKAVEASAARAIPEKVVEIRYAAGHIMYVRADGTLWAAPFDRRAGRITAKPVQIASNVSISANGVAQLAVSKNGTAAYLPETPRWLGIVTLDGHLHAATPARELFSNPRFSPDGKQIAVDIIEAAGRDVWIVSMDNGSLARATFERDAHDAVWTPDGKSITWTSFRLGALGIYRSRPGAAEKPDSVFTEQRLAYSGDWLKDGSGLVTTATDLAPGSRFDIGLVTDEGRGPIVPVLADRFETRFPAVSPDGKWLAYVSNESGSDEVYIRPWNRDGTVLRLSANGGTEPVWSPDERSIFYRETASRYLINVTMSVSQRSIVITGRRWLFPVADMIPGFSHANFDVAPDGRTFAMVWKPASDSITVLQNVSALIRRAAAARDSAGKSTLRAP